ncbi:phosphoribosylglycinamide formyltransferase [Allomuricauda sp. d1]|uniref:phosphoribosylglycinamide formyltransferase n=1 Tax=Allomuricauda sp. d1 TaxID=3136725 RepID=UPI0031D947A8
MKKLVILASGSGSNAENIITYFKDRDVVQVTCVLTNKASAGVLKRCQRLAMPAFYFNRHAYDNGQLLKFLASQEIDFIILAGFLWKISEDIVNAYPNKIVNIHPALLPKYGGKGMYGSHVHEAVKANNETETGITIHFVNENYDEGNIIFQARTKISMEDTAETIAEKVHALEYEHYPKIIEKLLGNG